MDHFVTIMTFNHPMELAVLRTRLEANGIECFIKDELTTQVTPFYSSAIGGVKLQVKESDVQKSIEILKEGGYINDEDLQRQKKPNKFETATSCIPLLKYLRLELRLMIIVASTAIILIGIIYFATLPTTFERLTKQSWCVDQITYKGQTYTATTDKSIQLSDVEFCQESIDMRTNGTIILPGFNSRASWGRWVLVDNAIEISQIDTFDFVYNGRYNIDVSADKLILKSKETTLYCHPQKIHVNLPF